MSDRDPLEQLTAFRIRPDDERRASDLEAIRREVARRPHAGRGARRRWTLGVVVALMIAGPTAAVAGNDALPGDLLYPVKRAVEPILRLFDGDVVVDHRVAEVAGLVDRRADDSLIEERVDLARRALAVTDAPAAEQRLDSIVDRWEGDRPDSSPPVTDSAPVTTATVEPNRDGADRTHDRSTDETSTTSTTSEQPRDAAPPADRSTTTTSADGGVDVPPSDGDRPRDRP